MTEYHNVAFIFPGQGAQYPGMGKDFASEFSEAKQTFEEADDLLHTGLSSLIFQGEEEDLKQTKRCQSAIYVDCIAILRVVRTLFPDLRPSVCAGLSLGEYTALTASERLGFNDCLPLIHHRGQYMHEACEATKGGMAVIVGLSAAAVEAIIADINMPEDLWAANFNCPGQVVISGTERGVEAGAAAAKAQGAKRVVPLKVHGAFHSGLMSSAEERLAKHIQAAPIVDGTADIVMNVPGDYVTNLEDIRTNLIKQITSPVRWEQGIHVMMDHAVDLFVEMGPGNTLAGMNRRIGVSVPTVSIDKITDLSALEKLYR